MGEDDLKKETSGLVKKFFRGETVADYVGKLQGENPIGLGFNFGDGRLTLAHYLSSQDKGRILADIPVTFEFTSIEGVFKSNLRKSRQDEIIHSSSYKLGQVDANKIIKAEKLYIEYKLSGDESENHALVSIEIKKGIRFDLSGCRVKEDYVKQVEALGGELNTENKGQKYELVATQTKPSLQSPPKSLDKITKENVARAQTYTKNLHANTSYTKPQLAERTGYPESSLGPMLSKNEITGVGPKGEKTYSIPTDKLPIFMKRKKRKNQIAKDSLETIAKKRNDIQPPETAHINESTKGVWLPRKDIDKLSKHDKKKISNTLYLNKNRITDNKGPRGKRKYWINDSNRNLLFDKETELNYVESIELRKKDEGTPVDTKEKGLEQRVFQSETDIPKQSYDNQAKFLTEKEKTLTLPEYEKIETSSPETLENQDYNQSQKRKIESSMPTLLERKDKPSDLEKELIKPEIPSQEISATEVLTEENPSASLVLTETDIFTKYASIKNLEDGYDRNSLYLLSQAIRKTGKVSEDKIQDEVNYIKSDFKHEMRGGYPVIDLKNVREVYKIYDYDENAKNNSHEELSFSEKKESDLETTVKETDVKHNHHKEEKRIIKKQHVGKVESYKHKDIVSAEFASKISGIPLRKGIQPKKTLETMAAPTPTSKKEIKQDYTPTTPTKPVEQPDYQETPSELLTKELKEGDSSESNGRVSLSELQAQLSKSPEEIIRIAKQNNIQYELEEDENGEEDFIFTQESADSIKLKFNN